LLSVKISHNTKNNIGEIVMVACFSVFLCAFLAFMGLHWYRKQADSWLEGEKSKIITNKSSLTRVTNPFRCVEIEPCAGACEKVKSYKNLRILMDKAPALPLHGCEQKKCACKFIRHDDRRSKERREKENAARQLIKDMQGTSDHQRGGPDRRKA
jgi:hypothetical protein